MPNIKKLPYGEIASLYASNTMTVENIAIKYMTTTRSIQRIAKVMGVNITQSEANKRTAKLKNYYHKPEHLKIKRTSLPAKIRFIMLYKKPYCSICGAKSKDGIRLEIDHIDNNPTNHDMNNLQVLCNLCNKGKYEVEKSYY